MRILLKNFAGRRSRCLLGIFFALVGLVLAGCSDPRSETDSSSIIRRGLSGDPESLDPHHYSSDQAAFILRDIGEGLLAYSPDGQLKNAVAESWSISADGLQYNFVIRESAKWSDGTPIRAADFVNSLRRLVDPKTGAPFAPLLLPLENASKVIEGVLPADNLGAYAVDRNRLRLDLESPTPFFPQILAHPAAFPLHKSFVDAAESGDASAYAITNGAYKLAEWNVGADVRLVRNPYYWDDEKTTFDVVRWVAVEGLEETNRYRAGQLDTTQNVASSLFAKIREENPDELRVAPTLGVYFYGFNLKEPTFSENPELRTALSLALDRAAITSQITRRGEEPAYSWVPPGIVGYTTPTIEFHNLEKTKREELAQKLYKEAGYGKDRPLRFELRYNTSDMQETIAIAAQSMWREVLGADVTLVNEEFKVLLSNIQEGVITQMFRRISWTGDYNDPAAFLQLLETNNPSNFMRYSNAEVDRLLEQASRANDSRERMSLLAKAELRILLDQPVIPIYFYVSKHLVAKNLDGWEDNVLDIHYSKDLRRRPGASR